MIENRKNPVTKEQLINILKQKNNEEKYPNQREIAKEEISNIIDYIIALEINDNKIYRYKDLISQGKIYQDYNDTDFSNNFQNLYFFKIDDNKYIYISPNLDLGVPKTEKDVVDQINNIIDNNLNGKKYIDYLKYLKNNYEKEIYDINKSEIITEQKFKEYDYIKIIKENNDYKNINIKDIKNCINFLAYDEKTKKYLTLDEKVGLYLIILLGIKNIYLYNSNYFKEESNDYINSIYYNIDQYIDFIEKNKKNVINETKYSLSYDYLLNLYEYLNSATYDIPNCKKFEDSNIHNIMLILKLISFNYHVLNNKYEQAKYDYEKYGLKYYFILYEGVTSKTMFDRFLIDLDCYKLDEIKNASYNFFEKHELEPSIKRNVKVILQFYICTYYYFKNSNDKENTKKIYEFLLYFRKNFEIEDFIVKCNYYKMVEDILNLKIEDDNKIDEAIEKIDEVIQKMIEVDDFDKNDVILNYPNIKFENLDEKVKTYVATGDKIVNTFKKDKNNEFDYSSAVIEWSKAVELEIKHKIIDKIKSNKNEIEKYSKEHNPNKEKNFILYTEDVTIGTFKALKDYNLLDYLYDEYIKQIYTIDKDTYNNLNNYIISIRKTRNDSAHKEKSIDIITASECKDKILEANKILEILSKLQEK